MEGKDDHSKNAGNCTFRILDGWKKRNVNEAANDSRTVFSLPNKHNY
jgi:hypothetical protein